MAVRFRQVSQAGTTSDGRVVTTVARQEASPPVYAVLVDGEQIGRVIQRGHVWLGVLEGDRWPQAYESGRIGRGHSARKTAALALAELASGSA